MPGCLPARYRLLDLLFSLWGTCTFLADLCSDIWSAVKYYKAGDTAWALLFIGFYLLSSVVLQLLSWGWYWVDGMHLQEQEKAPEPGNEGSVNLQDRAGGDAAQIIADDDYVERSSLRGSTNGGMEHHSKNGAKDLEGAGRVTSVMDAVPVEKTVPQLGEPVAPSFPTPCDILPQKAATSEGRSKVISCCSKEQIAAVSEDVSRFWTSRIILRPSCFTILHILQLGYPLRCIMSLEVGFAAFRHPEYNQFKDYAYYLTHDISMMRLVETFLENTPQLILVLYIIIQRGAIQTFQCFNISMTFFCISWAILDYHQSLRLYLKGKLELSILSSAIYYLWNFCLISSRILLITLFSVTFHLGIALHFLFLWLAFFIWACLQKTTFMEHKVLEIIYRGAVAVILYFSWFNIADGRTVYRCIVYYVFIVVDSMLLVVSWVTYKDPSILDGYETFIIVMYMIFFVVGLFLRLLYYKCLHPNVLSKTKQYADVPDGITAGTKVLLSAHKTAPHINKRMKHLAEQIY